MHPRLPYASFALVLASCASLYAQTVEVPFVGCKSDGQVGPLEAPIGRPKQIAVPAEVAAKLAYYKAENSPGVFGPRGWNCFSTYGQNGSNLYLSKEPIDTKDVFADGWNIKGPAMQLSLAVGDTSGRFEVAQAIARVFPAHIAFTRRVIAEGIEPASDFPRGPYPYDKLTYRSKEVVEYETPANQEGLGTHTRLAREATPVQGVLVLNTKDDQALYHLAIRLPVSLSALGPTIIQQVEQACR